jgi:molybdopterin converting factor small subunit
MVEAIMLVTVKLYASLSRYAGGELSGTPFEIEIREGASLQELIDCLSIPVEETKVAFVNGVVQQLDWKLEPGDQVGIFPPIGGG